MDKQMYEAGMKLRRKVVGAEYVDKAMASADELTADFQQLVTAYSAPANSSPISSAASTWFRSRPASLICFLTDPSEQPSSAAAQH